MIIAISIWNDRIAPVFDVARRLRLLTVENGRITATADVACAEESLHARAQQLFDCHVHTLICGAISRELESVIAGNGIQVIPFTAGETTAVASNWLSGQLLKNDCYLMPGCCRRHKNRFHAAHLSLDGHRRRMAFSHRPDIKAGRQGGHSNGAREGSSENVRVCVHCGYREADCCDGVHPPRKCPQCGSAMREV